MYDIASESRLTQRPLRRVRRGRVLAGVCGGAARWLGWEVTVVRVAVVVLAMVTSVVPVVLAYGLLALIVPEDRSRRRALEWWDQEREREDWLAS